MSKFKGLRNQFVLQIPNATPMAIQITPAVFAERLRFHHKTRQIRKPRTGGKNLISFFSGFRTKYRMNAAAFTPMKAISAPKFSSCAPRLYDWSGPTAELITKTLIREMTPTKITLLRGTCRMGSTAPKNDFGDALLRPMPKSNRAAPNWAPIPDPKFATTRVNPTIVNSGAQARAAAKTKAVVWL